MKYSRCDNANICADSLTKMSTITTTNGVNSLPDVMTTTVTNSGYLHDAAGLKSAAASAAAAATTAAAAATATAKISPTNQSHKGALFSEEFRTVENFFEKWSDCERTVVMYALLKRLRYPCLKFLQYSIDNNLTQHAISQSTMNAVIADINANNPAYLQNLLNAYNTFHLNDMNEVFSSTSSPSAASAASSTSSASSSASSSSCTSDKESMPCYGSADYTMKPKNDERKAYNKKEDILYEVLNILPLLKPGNEDAKTIYLTLIPNVVKDTVQQIVPAELVQQLFSYLLIHPAVSNDDRRSLSCWLRQLEDYLQGNQRHSNSLFVPQSDFAASSNKLMTAEGVITSLRSASLSAASGVSAANAGNNFSFIGGRSTDWQTIAPPTKHKHQFQQLHPKVGPLSEWTEILTRRRQSSGCIPLSTMAADQLCDKFNGITLNELASSQSNNLGLASLVGDANVTTDGSETTLANGVAAAAKASLFGGGGNNGNGCPVGQSNPIINIISNNNCEELTGDDHDTSFSKNGTDFDFEPTMVNVSRNTAGSNNAMQQLSAAPLTEGTSFASQSQPPPPAPPTHFPTMLLHNTDQLDVNRWSLDSKLAALKTRRSNSLTTQTISTSSSSSNSSVITVNDNCSNSTENLAQFANKPRSFSLSIENQQQQRAAMINGGGGSDTRLDDFKPSYIKFQSRNVGMSSIGAWLKSLRLHKYIELFHNMTYEEMLQISEEYLQSLGVTKGASHKLSLCIDKLKDRPNLLIKLEQDLLSGQQHIHRAVEDLMNIVLTPMKPIESVNASLGEDNVALLFLRVIDLVCSIVQRDPYALPDDENLSSIVWILDRAIHCEAFVNHINQLKDLKFQISKLKISFAPRMHYSKNGNGGSGVGVNLSKTRWNVKPRKCDSKNGSNDRINYRKNSGDMLNFPLSLSQQQQQQQQAQQQQQQQQSSHQQGGGEYLQMMNGSTSSGNNNSQYKNASYSNFMNQQQQQQQQSQQQSQQQFQSHMPQQQPNHYPALPQSHSHTQPPVQQSSTQQQHQHQQQQQQQQHGRSLNNLIVISGGPQQPQKMIFKPGHQQGILSTANPSRTSADNLQMENVLQHQQQQQQRKGSLSGGSLNTNNVNMGSSSSNNNGGAKNANTYSVGNNESQQQQQQKKTMAAVVMVSNDELLANGGGGRGGMVVGADMAATIDNVMNNQQQHHQQQQHSIANATEAAAASQQAPQILINHNTNLLGNDASNMISQQQLQLLAVAAAAVASSCNMTINGNVMNAGAIAATAAAGSCPCGSNNNNSSGNNNNSNNNNNNNNNHSNNNSSNNNCSSCSICCSDFVPTTAATTTPPSNGDTLATLVAVHNMNSMLSIDNATSKYKIITAGVDGREITRVNDMIISSNNNNNSMNDMRSLEQLETLCLQMTEQAIN